MKNFRGLIFAGAVFAFWGTGFAQNSNIHASGKMTWQQYDSLAAVNAFNRDTISALENYRRSLELNPLNDHARKNYVRLNHLFIKSRQSFYDVNP